MRRTLFIAFLLATLPACETPQAVDPNPERVTLAELQPPDPLRSPAGVADASERPPILHRLGVRRLVFARPSPRLSFAVDALKPPPVDAETLARWRANGFGIGQLPAHMLPLFLANTRGSVAINYATHIGPTQWVPLVLIERVTGDQPFTYTLPDGEPQPRVIRNGRQQLLIKLDRVQGDADDDVRLVILPHHYKQDVALVPRTPQEKLLDGNAFFDLLLQARIAPESVWIIWATLPGDDPAAGGGASGGVDTADGEPDDGPVVIPRPGATAHRAATLAETMLTGHRGSDPVQLIVILKVEPPGRESE